MFLFGMLIAGMLATPARVLGYETSRVGPGRPPGPPFEQCRRGILDGLKGYWCIIFDDIRVWVPDQ